jgi:AraC-like DNA-binding protein
MGQAVRAVVLDIFKDRGKRLPKLLFLESKPLELITLQLGGLMAENAGLRLSNALNPNEMERIRAARKWLVQDLLEPPTLRNLENHFCLSHNKLQIGFRALFGNSVFGCLREHKMQRARLLLSRAEMNVSQVAWEVGYINVSQFTKTFKKRFGNLPKHYRQSVLTK